MGSQRTQNRGPTKTTSKADRVDLLAWKPAQKWSSWKTVDGHSLKISPLKHEADNFQRLSLTICPA